MRRKPNHNELRKAKEDLRIADSAGRTLGKLLGIVMRRVGWLSVNITAAEVAKSEFPLLEVHDDFVVIRLRPNPSGKKKRATQSKTTRPAGNKAS